MQLHLSLVHVIAFLVAIAAAGSRLIPATKPFWTWLPAWATVALPLVPPALAMLQSGLAGVTTWTDLAVVLLGFGAMLMPGLPSNRSSEPLQQKKGVSVPPAATLMLTFILVVTFGIFCSACGWFSGTAVPAVEHCAPSAADLLSQAEQVLAGDDYVAELEKLAEKDGKDLVLCAVNEIATKPLPGVQASPEKTKVRANAKAYLASKGAK